MSPLKQVKINAQRHQKPEYRDTRSIILKKSKSLLKDITKNDIENLRIIGNTALFLTNDAGCLTGIDTETIHLTVTSPPFLDVVQYADDNWLRCWFNNLNVNEIGAKITMARTLDQWIVKMESVFKELYRITKTSGHVAFEAGEVRKGKINLDENVADIGCSTGFTCDGIMINQQLFTKTSNIWGISNNERGTNTNRIVIFTK
jgi:hypothetical protein